MSDLIILPRQTAVPPQVCTESPPEPTESTPRPPDDCFVNVAFQDSSSGTQPPHRVRFDRVGSQFVLSPTNSQEIQAWYQSHENTTDMERTLRVAGYLTRTPNLTQGEEFFPIFLVIAQYIATGETRMPSGDHELGDPMDLAHAVMDIIADSSSRAAVGSLLGQLQLMRQESWISQDSAMTDRIQWISNIVDLIPVYRTFRLRFLEESDITGWDSLSPQRQRQVQAILSFSQEVVLSQRLGRPLRYGPHVQRAYDAYNQLFREAQVTMERGNFCVALGDAVEALNEHPGSGATFIQDCGIATAVREQPEERQPLASVRNNLESFLGSQTLMEGVSAEAERANMGREFFFPNDREARRSVRALFDNFFSHLSLQVQDGQPEVRFDFDAFRIQQDISLRDEDATRREYLILGLALMRRYFNSGSGPRPVRALYEGRFREIPWHLEEGQLDAIRDYSRSLERRLGVSHESSDQILPWMEGGILALGIAGMVLSFVVPDIRNNEILFNTVGGVSSGLSGFGLFSLGTHLLGEEVFDIQNHYAWDLGMGAAGLAVGVGTFLLLSLLGGFGGGGIGPDDRFPVDSYGP